MAVPGPRMRHSKSHSAWVSERSEGSAGAEGLCSIGSRWFNRATDDADNSVAQWVASHICVGVRCAIVNHRDCCAIRAFPTGLSRDARRSSRRFRPWQPSAVYHLGVITPAHSKMSNRLLRATRTSVVSLLFESPATCIFDP